MIKGRNANPTAINTNETNITGRTPNRSVQYPINGARIPEMNENVNERFNSVWFHPYRSCNGPANSPNEYCVIPIDNPVERNTKSAAT